MISQNYRFLKLLLPCPHLVWIYSTEFTQPLLLHPRGHYPRCGRHIKIAPSIADICHLHRGLYISVTTSKLNVTVNGVTASEDVCIGYSTKHSVWPNMKIAKLWNTFFQPFNTENVNLTTTLFSKFHNADIMTIITSGELSEILEGSIGTALSVESARTVWLTGSLTRTFGMLMVWYIHISNNTLCFYLNQLN